MIKLIVVLLTILTSMFSALREVIDLERNTMSWIYNWNLGFWNADAFHSYPFAETILHISIPLIMVLIIGTPIYYIPIYLFVFYQIRNLFIHEILPLSIHDNLDHWQAFGIGLSFLLMFEFIVWR